ncbi:hypothetical protein Tco_0975445 [Tanacetum coccineum]|uniref:Uncharacterized protein n=1 Tax=Tanacetum coccineum TaxID=301880 RepID=A0ABQ5EEH8_9ASTR
MGSDENRVMDSQAGGKKVLWFGSSFSYGRFEVGAYTLSNVQVLETVLERIFKYSSQDSSRLDVAAKFIFQSSRFKTEDLSRNWKLT